MEPAAKLAVTAAGVFFLTALITGIWKYLQMRDSPTGRAHVYVDTAHRASLLYSFAALLLERFVELSTFSSGVELVATAFPLLFFAAAIANYIVQGRLAETENMLAGPKGRTSAVTGFMVALIVAEIGGFLVLFLGFLSAELI